MRKAFLLRAVVAVLLTLFTDIGLFAPDEYTYSWRAAYHASYWRGEVVMSPLESMPGQPLGYYYLLAVLYLPFGENLFLGRLLNAWVGSRAVLEAIRVTRLLGGTESASLRAGRFLAYFPSQVLWSALVVRDVWVQWILLLMARQIIELRGRILLSRILGVVFLIWSLLQFRAYLLYAAVGPLVLSFIIGPGRDALRNLALGLVVVLGLVWVDAGQSGTEDKIQNFDLRELQRLRSWSSLETVAGSGFASDADVSTLGGALSLLPVGLAYFFFAPFPWQWGSFRQALAIPETLWFYTLVPGIIAGFLHLLRHRFQDASGILLMTLSLTFGYAIGQGNVGTLYRHKAQVIAFYYAFAAIGDEARRRSRIGAMEPGPIQPADEHLRAPAAYTR